MKKYKPSEAMSTNQKRGRAMKGKKTTRSYSSPYAVTSKSFDDEMTLDDVKAIYGFLTSQKQKINKYNVDTDGSPTDDYLDWLDSGATAGLAWSTTILQEEGILKSVTKSFEDDVDTEETSNWTKVQVVKAVNNELKQGTFLALSPEEVDLHGDVYSAEEVRKACHNFNLFCMKANLLHLIETDSFSIVESYITPVDMVLGEKLIKAGSWITVLQFWDDELWEEVKKGNFTGVSVGCSAQVEYLEDDDE